MVMSEETGSPGDRINKLVTYFLQEADASQENDPSDVFGIRPRMFLVEALRLLEAPVAEWDCVAVHSLEKPMGFALYHKPILSAACPHVSQDAAERIRAHFVDHGELRALQEILRVRFWRTPDSAEIRAIAEYHRRNETSTAASIWKDLMEVAEGDDATYVRGLFEAVATQEEDDHIPF
jgi:hypothetical protein